MRLPADSRSRAVLALVALAAAAAALAGAIELAWHARLFAGRLTFPLDLEWMEGGMLVHAQRLARGQQLYVPPSLEFIPFLYTPLYPALLAALSKVLPLGYTLGRAVSLIAFAGTLALIVVTALREAPDRLSRVLAALVAVAAAGAVAAGFELTGAFYDLARADSLLLLCESSALVLAFSGRSLSSAAAAGVAMALAFLTKQTGPVVGIGIGVGLLWASWRRALVYGAVAGALMGLGLLYLVKSSHGWFWTYVFKLHQSHPFRPDTLGATPLLLWNHGWPVLVVLCLATIGLALGGRLRRGDAVLWGGALGGLASGVLGFATMWAWPNAFIPAVVFPIFAAAVLTARLVVHAAQTRRAGAVAFAAACALAFVIQSAKVGRPLFAARMPQPADRAAAAQFLARLRTLSGDGFIPFHPFYGALAGHHTFVHRMGVMDVGGSLGRPAGLDAAIRDQRFPWIILDWKSQPGEWPGLDARYRVVHTFRDGVDAVRAFSGAETSPRWLMVPVHDPPPLPPGGRRIADFEGTVWQGWTPQGLAFGAPAPAPDGLYGRSAADSGVLGPAVQGSLRSQPLTLDRPHLRFSVSGPADPGLRVLLISGAETARVASPEGGVRTVEWDVRELMGRPVVLVLEDQSAAASLAVDEIVAY
jgi:hypothetical protein